MLGFNEKASESVMNSIWSVKWFVNEWCKLGGPKFQEIIYVLSYEGFVMLSDSFPVRKISVDSLV